MKKENLDPKKLTFQDLTPIMFFEVTAEVVLSQPNSSLPAASPPESFGFIITINGLSFSTAVVPNGTGNLVPGKPTEVNLHFLFPEAAAAVHAGDNFTFFEQYRVGTGRVLSVRNA